jgi:hypothetical protein
MNATRSNGDGFSTFLRSKHYHQHTHTHEHNLKILTSSSSLINKTKKENPSSPTKVDYNNNNCLSVIYKYIFRNVINGVQHMFEYHG